MHAPLETTPAPQDRPLDGDPHPRDRLHWAMYAAEFAGTAVLVFAGLSIVIALWGKGAPFADLPLDPPARRALNGALFGSVGAAIAISPLGRISGAHVNPAMTFGFWAMGRLGWRDALFYAVSQLLGGALGAVLLLVWGAIGASDHWAGTQPSPRHPIGWAVAGEALCTFLLVQLVFAFAARRRLQPFTPLISPVLFCLLTWLEAPLSGASANPARSFGPELIAANFHAAWVYWVGPLSGAALAVLVTRWGGLGWHWPHQARLFHFGHPGGTGQG